MTGSHSEFISESADIVRDAEIPASRQSGIQHDENYEYLDFSNSIAD